MIGFAFSGRQVAQQLKEQEAAQTRERFTSQIEARQVFLDNKGMIPKGVIAEPLVPIPKKKKKRSNLDIVKGLYNPRGMAFSGVTN